MDDIQSVTVIDRLEKLTHVVGRQTLRKVLVGLRGDLVKEGLTLG